MYILNKYLFVCSLPIFIFHRGNYTICKYSKRKFPTQNRICTLKGDYTVFDRLFLSHTKLFTMYLHIVTHVATQK